MNSPLLPFAVYFVGNDRVYDWLLAAWRSVRAIDPEVPIFLIEYDDHQDRLSRVLPKFGIQRFTPPDLDYFEQQAQRIWPGQMTRWFRCMRRFAMMEGPSDYGLYLDADLVVLTPPTELFRIFQKHKLDFLSFDQSYDFVYTDQAYIERMIAQHDSKGFNSGAFLTRRGLIDRQSLQRNVTDAIEEKAPLFELPDQSLINYCVDRLHCRHRLLSEVEASFCPKPWARIGTPEKEAEGLWRLRSDTPTWNGGRLPFYHWADYRLDHQLPALDVWESFRLQGADPVERCAYQLRNAKRRAQGALYRRLPAKLGAIRERIKPSYK